MRYLFLLAVLFTVTVAYAQSASDKLTVRASVYFASASYEVSEAELDSLEKFANELKSYASYSLRIEAHTDEQGSPAYNNALARRRADHVAGLLSEQSVTTSNVEVVTFGERQAETGTTTDQERRRDRRVDLIAEVVGWEDTEALVRSLRRGQVQTFDLVSTETHQTITGQRGGAFQIPANAFLLPDGSLFTGSAKVRVVEAYDLADMVLAGLTTTSDGRQLKTGGMVKLTVESEGGVPLRLKPGSAITASIPTEDFKPEMRIFEGSELAPDGTPENWSLTRQSVAGSEAEIGSTTDALPTYEEYQAAIAQILDKYEEKFRAGAKDVDLIGELNAPAGRAFVQWLRDNPVDTIAYVNPLTYRLRRKPDPADTLLSENLFGGSTGIFTSRKKKTTLARQRRQRALSTFRRKQLRYDRSVAYRDSLPAMNARKRRANDSRLANWSARVEEQKALVRANPISYEMYLQLEANARRNVIRQLRGGMDMLPLRSTAMAKRKIENSVLGRYFFSVLNLGWVNCDVFRTPKDPIRVYARVPEATLAANVLILPKRQRGVLPLVATGQENVWRINGMPKRAAYHLIAYEVKDGQVLLAHQFVRNASAGVVELAYEPVAETELRERLETILGC